MASAKAYEELIYRINNLLKQGDLYQDYVKDILGGKNDFKISQVYNKKQYKTDWIDIIEGCIVELDTIVRNPRKFIVIEEDIVDISLAKSISVESIKHLSQHTNLISSVDEDTDTVLPSKILNTSKEESFEIYENRFIYTLLLKIRDFIDIRFNAIKNALFQSGELEINVKSEFSIDDNRVDYNLASKANFPFDPAVALKGKGQLSDVERVVRIKSIISDFLNSPFAREMRSCALVRPPITRTNVILKDPNFKKALVLWQYIETAEKMDFKIEVSKETTEMSPALSDRYRGLIFLNTVLMQSIAGTRDLNETVESAKRREKQVADEYVTKNIDDFVPDDFPFLKMDLSEIKRVYTRVTGDDNPLLGTEEAKLLAGIDRALRQSEINSLKERSRKRKTLVAEQLREEKRAKILALREEKDLERQKRHADARLRIEARVLEENRKGEIERLKRETAELERKKAEALEKHERDMANLVSELQRELLEKKELYERLLSKKDELIELEKSAKLAYLAAQRDYEESIRRLREELENARSEQEDKMWELADYESRIITLKRETELLEERTAERLAATERVKKNKDATMSRLMRENDEFWTDFKNALVKLGVEKKLAPAYSEQRRKLREIDDEERRCNDIVAQIRAAFVLGLNYEKATQYAALIELARHNRTDAEIDRVMRRYEDFRLSRAK